MTTLADIEKQYDEALKRARGRPEVEAEIRVERAQAVADFRLREVVERERTLWMREALSTYPLAAEFPDRVTGDTEKDIQNSAKALHDKLLGAFEKHRKQAEIDALVKAHLEGNHPTEAPTGDAEPA